MDSRTRLFEVIEMAGGLVSNADTDSINRAEYVEDGEKIIIPSRPVISESSVLQDGSGEPEAADPSSASLDYGVSSSADSGLVNINYATKEELMSLPGIGESKAEKIIEYRSSNRFRKKEDII